MHESKINQAKGNWQQSRNPVTLKANWYIGKNTSRHEKHSRKKTKDRFIVPKHARKFITACTNTCKEDDARQNRINNKLTTERKARGIAQEEPERKAR
jgi:hypothetical protein